MKNLGAISLLLVLTSHAFAEAEDSASQERGLTLALNDFVVRPPLMELQSKRFAVEKESTLDEVNAKLEARLEQKLDALLAVQLQNLD